ncbi:MAG: hypothetical protein K1X64_18685 [Myxococcaceae bacterium]|nr:hypothetical protein [Myxococcaceae bacterium]
MPSRSTEPFTAVSNRVPVSNDEMISLMGQPPLPGRTNVTGSLVVRPDVLVQQVVVRASDIDAPKAFQAARNRLDEIEKKASETSGGLSKLKMKDLVSSRSVVGKAFTQVELSGEIVILLSASNDYWTRARLALALARLAEVFDSQGREVRAPGVTVSISQPSSMVSDAERFRSQLNQAWAKRARDFADAAQSDGAPIDVQDCEAPGDIVQSASSLEQVTLSMRVACRLDVVRKGSERRSARK